MKRNRFLSLLLSALILLTVVFPVGAFAGDWEEETFGSAEEYCWDEYVLQEENWDTYEEGNSSDEYVPYEETCATPEEDLTEQPSENLDASEEDLPQDRLLQAQDRAHQRGLSGAVFSDDAEKIALVDRKCEVLERGNALIFHTKLIAFY